MKGVIITQDWGYHSYYKKLVKPAIWLFLSAALVINLGYMLGIMTRPAVNRQDTLNLLYAETGLLNRPGFGL